MKLKPYIPVYTTISQEIGYIRSIISGKIILDFGTSVSSSITQIAKATCLDKSTVSKAIKWLERENYIKSDSKEFYPEDAKEFLTEKPKSTYWIGDGQRCEWCESFSPVLQLHHYPIAKANAGKKTVKICPGCHAEYHYLVDGEKYIPTKKLLRLIEE
ncbi:MAG: hypothetical protein GY796_36455 [Chloroflexi bacterium]|nr:hypothetical protein [Chloroflexota bacterium]